MFAFCSESYVIIQAGYSFTTHTYILRIYKNNTPYHYFAPGETPVGFASEFGVGLDRFPHAVFSCCYSLSTTLVCAYTRVFLRQLSCSLNTLNTR